MSEPGTAVAVVESVELGVVSASSPAQLVAKATDAANALAGVIEAKKLYANISGRKFVKCEGWTTLAAMMGVLPREAGMNLRDDGGYEATVELVRITDGVVLTRASAECGPDEPTWKNRAAYARRSMAATRATSKACRLAFSWVMALAGYEVTPLEEMPPEETQQATRGRTGTPPVGGTKEPTKPSPVAASQSLDEKPAALAKPDEPAPWETLSVTRDEPCPLDPKKRAVKDLRRNQLKFVEAYLDAHPDYPKADEWRIVVQKELASA